MAEEDNVNWDVMLPVVGACSGLAACCSVGVVVYCWFKVRHEISGTGGGSTSRRRFPAFSAVFGDGGARDGARSPRRSSAAVRRPRGQEISFTMMDDSPDASAAEDGLSALAGVGGVSAADRAAQQRLDLAIARKKSMDQRRAEEEDEDDDARSVCSRTSRKSVRMGELLDELEASRAPDSGQLRLPTLGGSRAAGRGGRNRPGVRVSERVQTHADGSQDVFV